MYVNFINIKYYVIYGTIQIFQLSNYIFKHVLMDENATPPYKPRQPESFSEKSPLDLCVCEPLTFDLYPLSFNLT